MLNATISATDLELVSSVMMVAMVVMQGIFELAILKYPHGTDPEITSNIIYDTQINKDLGCVDVHGWLDFGEVHVMLQRIRNYNTGDYCYNA